MKKIMTNIKTLAALLMVGVAFAACSSSDDSIVEQPVNPTEPKTYTMIVQATKPSGDAAATRGLSYDDDTKELKTTWEEGEIVKVYQSDKEIGELTAAASDNASTTLTGYFTDAPSTTAPLTFYFHTNKSTSYSDQDGTLKTIASTYDSCEPATVDAEDFAVDEENHTISVPAGIRFGANKQAIVRFRLQYSNGNDKLSASTLLVKLGGKDIIVKPTDDGGLSELYVAVPPVSNAKVKLYAIEADVFFYHYTKSGVTFAAGKFYTITVNMEGEEIKNLSEQGRFDTLNDGDILVGSIDDVNEIKIAKGATVMLRDAHITSTSRAGITCLGDATIVVANEDEDPNEITSASSGYPGIQVAAGYTLTILGPGTLTATGANGGAGIGAGKDQTAGNIIIAGGTITANGGSKAAGIGSGVSSSSASSCGNILIKGGTVTANGGASAAGIGSGTNSACGDITITTGVTSVTATAGDAAKNSIGPGQGYASCGTITIGCTLDENGNPVDGKGDDYTAGGYGTGTYTYPETE